MAIGPLAWHRRLEARVIVGVAVLVALSLAAVLLATTRAVTARARERTTVDLDAARLAFHRVVSDRGESASAQSALVTALPVFRAHLTDTRLRQDDATVQALAEHYRQQLKAAFAIVADRDGRWLAAAGWASGEAPSAEIAGAVTAATSGTSVRSIAVAGHQLYLVISEPAGFADETLGTLTVGYPLDDELATRLAEVTHRQVNLIGGGRIYASSLPQTDRAELAAAVKAGWPGDSEERDLRRFGDGEYAVGVFPLAAAGTSVAPARLILLDDWAPTQTFLDELRRRLLATGAFIFIAAVGMGVFFSRRMARPLEDLAAAAQDIAGGNWTRQLAVRGSAEEAVMAEAVNSMTTSIRHWYEEAKLRDDQLRQAQKVEEMGRLAGGVAHDFNNFLTAIKGYSELLLESFETGDKRRAKAEGILKAADTAAGLTRQLLAFSRKRVVAVQVLSLDRLILGTEKMLNRLIGEDIELKTSIGPDAGCVKADPHQIEQILLNLVVNARDAMPRGGRIDVMLDGVTLADGPDASHLKLQPGRYVRLTVRDGGCGMTSEVKSRIFEPFFTTKQEGKGTGLGLAVVFSIVEQLGGGISVETEPDRGTTFHVYLPHTAEPQPETNASPSAAAVNTGSETILLVEDEPQVSTLVTRALQKSGYTVVSASRGAEALEILQTSTAHIDLLLTDIVMPGMNGRELADRVKVLRRDIRVLYMSGYSDDAVLRHGVEAATMQFIAKPFSITALTCKVRDALAQPIERVA
jgi:signal transduction histidine kinase/ActR/RegA family two-component response regulator